MLTETNGNQFYKNWGKLETYHPRAGAERTKPKMASLKQVNDATTKAEGYFFDAL